MLRTTRLLTAGSFVSAAVVGGLVVGGVIATTATLVITDPTAPAASADSLRQFDDCDELLDYYIDNSIDDVGPYGWGGSWGPIMPLALDGLTTYRAAEATSDTAATAPTSGTGLATGQSGSATGTNTQEVDVDEPDVAKTDGRILVHLVDERVLVIDDVTGDEPRELGRLSLPADTYGGELLLVGDHVLLTLPMSGWAVGRPTDTSAPDPAVGRIRVPSDGSGVLDVDISDPTDPRLVGNREFSGRRVSLRQYGDTIRLVTATPRPQLDWVTPDKLSDNPRKHWKKTERQATRRNKALVRQSTIEDWLPSIRTGADGDRMPLVDCADVYHPTRYAGSETVTVTTWDVAQPAQRDTVAVVADGQVVYSSADRLYVTSTDWADGRDRVDGTFAGDLVVRPRQASATTQVHAFALDGLDTAYVGSGHVNGTIRDRWSLDEYDGHLRVAWTRAGTKRVQNGLTVLTERDGALVATGEVGRLGIDENIQSVRWFDDLAVIVTFRQMDPLYTIDLTDQDHPKVLGKLKIPGFSGYLHPIGDDRLLGLGIDATDQGRSLGSQASVFDLTDLSDPKRLSTQSFGQGTDMVALQDPRTFTWLPGLSTGVTAVRHWGVNGDLGRLVTLEVDDSGRLGTRDLDTDVGWQVRTLPLPGDRIAVVDGSDVETFSLR